MAADWEARYAAADRDGLFGREPNVYVRQVLARKEFAGDSALCLADGDGRNGRWLAQQGLAVTAVDLSENATRLARSLDDAAGLRVERIAGDLANWSPVPGRRWQSAFIIYLQCERAVRLKAIATAWDALEPGGWLTIEGFAKDTSGAGGDLGPAEPDLLYSLDEVSRVAVGADVVEALSGQVLLDEGSRHRGLGQVIRFCARKPVSE